MPSEKLSVKTVGKCRPLTEDEIKQGATSVVKVTSDRITVYASGKEQGFSLDHCYGQDSKTEIIYHDVINSYVQRALMGNNATVLTLGVMGSGKSYLMTGIDEDPGVIPCVIKGLYKQMEEAKNKRFFVTVSFVEIFDEKLLDVLNPHDRDLKIREHPKLGIYVDGLSEFVVQSEDDLARLYEQGSRARKLSASDINVHRARSNGIFYINIEQKETNSSKIGVKSTITLADLASIEENGGAFPVVRVISAGKSGGHAPFRDSKITRLLQESLGGNAATVVLAVVSPSDKTSQQSIQTLTLGQSARSIKCQVKVNLDETASILADLRQEISRLRASIAKSNNPSKDDVVRMQTLIHDLQVAKQQTWQEKEGLSARYVEERKVNLANKGILEWVMDTMRQGDRQVQEKLLLLQREKDQLTLTYKDKRVKVDQLKDNLQKKITEYSKMAESGKSNEAETKKHVTAIHDLKEKLTKENVLLKGIKKKLRDIQDKQRMEKEAAHDQVLVKGNAELRQMVEAEERKRLEMENKAMIMEELDRVKIDAEHEKAEIQMAVSQGKAYSTEESMKNAMALVDLKTEKSVITMQLQALQQEKQHLTKDLENVYKRHKEEMEIQQLQHFQTFREYRETFEQQKAVIEQRYRSLLEDAVQDAIYLSSRNNELTEENLTLKQEIAEYKDKITQLGGQ